MRPAERSDPGPSVRPGTLERPGFGAMPAPKLTKLTVRLGGTPPQRVRARNLEGSEIRGLNGGSLSVIHILSAWTLIQVPLIVWAARSHNIARHRAAVRGMVTGALLIAGIFTFPFGRLLGHWLFG